MVFKCPNCSSDLVFNVARNVNSACNQNGYLNCSDCNINTPVINGITYFNESEIGYQSDKQEVISLLNERLAENRNGYQDFIDNKINRNLIDPYSAFQPFNESSRSFYPFIHSLRSILKPGDYILDTWCRTGWTAYFLSSIFPEQQIVSIWEGDNDVLGYSGFDYWFGQDRPKNLHIIFHDVSKPLPLPTGLFKAVHALDTLHRYEQTTLIPELLRVTSKDGLLICPHNHLTNSEPSPYFDRGEKQLHGLDYDRYFKQILTNQNRAAYILSEPGLFDLKSSRAIHHEPDTSDYNALIAILPSSLTVNLKPYNFASEEFNRLRIIVNPYFKFDQAASKAILDPQYLNGTVGVMLSRHPIYEKRCSSVTILSDEENKIIYLGRHNYSCLEIAMMLGMNEDQISSILSTMIDKELIQVLPICKRAVDLQLYHSAIPFSKSNHKTLDRLLHLNKENDSPIIIDEASDSQLFSDDLTYLVSRLKDTLVQSGINAESKLVVSSYPQFEALITFWAAMELGIHTYIISTELPKKQKNNLLGQLGENAFHFVDKYVFNELKDSLTTSHVIIYDDEDLDNHPLSFSNWLEKYPESEHEITQPPKNGQIAVTLFSSGTTGTPKGINLSHQALFQSGELMSRTFGWNSNDKILMISEMDAMSGLRNICVATRFTGTSIVIPSPNSNKSISIVDTIQKYEPTILACTPALIKQFLMLGARVEKALKSLRQVLCTAGNLPKNLVDEFQSLFGIRILNYYGLTETCGICVAETDSDIAYEGSIGISIDSIVQIVDEEEKILPKGEIGRLRVYNDRLSIGYLNSTDPSNLTVQNGWLYTGDLAYLSDDNVFFLKGRERHIIKDAYGNVIYLEEIENITMTHPNVKDLVLLKEQVADKETLLLVVAPIPEDDNLEGLKDQIRNLIKENIGESKIPAKIEVVSELTRDGRGNVSKELLTNISPKHADQKL